MFEQRGRCAGQHICPRLLIYIIMADKRVDPVVGSILSRTSVRLYEEGVEIPPHDMELILRAGMSAPSAVNRQPWAFVVVDDRDTLQRLADALPYAKMAATASAAVIVCGDRDHFLPAPDDTLWVQDVSAVSENILLAAHALGYGGVWTCVYPHPEREKPVSEILSLPSHIVPFNVIPLGKPSHLLAVKDKWDPDKIHLNRW